MKTKTILLAAGIMAASSPAWAIDVDRSTEVKASPDKVWALIGDFCGIGDWHPAVEKCSLSDSAGISTRTLTLAGGGGTLVEALVSRDDAAMSYTYKIVDGPLPVANYVSTISVRDGDEPDESEVSWTGTFDAKGAPDEKATEVIAGIYESGLSALKQKATQ